MVLYIVYNKVAPSPAFDAVATRATISIRFGSRGRYTRMLLKKVGLFIILALVAILTWACAAPPQLQGTDLGATNAPDFHLADQNGHPVALSDLRGQVVVLSFLYTQCVDICPIIANKLSVAYNQLGTAAQHVRFVAISVEPEEDTPAAIAAFSVKTGMAGRWLYLNGARAELEPVWRAYYIGTETPVPPSTTVGHSTRVVLIDRSGRERVNLDSDLVVSDLVQDLQILLNEHGGT